MTTEVYDWKLNGDGTFDLWVRRDDWLVRGAASGCRWEDYGSCVRIQYQFDLGILSWMGSGAQPDWLSLAGLGE